MRLVAAAGRADAAELLGGEPLSRLKMCKTFKAAGGLDLRPRFDRDARVDASNGMLPRLIMRDVARRLRHDKGSETECERQKMARQHP